MELHDDDDLQIRFLLYVDGVFLSEPEIANSLDTLLQPQTRKRLDRLTTDGAISIRYWDEELLGVDHADEIGLVITALSGRLPALLADQAVTVDLPYAGTRLHLVRHHNHVAYTRQRVLPDQPICKHVLPFRRFVRECELMYWRWQRLFDALQYGSSDSFRTRQRGDIDQQVEVVVGTEAIMDILEQPLANVLRHSTGKNL